MALADKDAQSLPATVVIAIACHLLHTPKRQSPASPGRGHSICKKVNDSPGLRNNLGCTSHCCTMRRAPLISSLGRQRHTPMRQSPASPGRPHLTCTLLPAAGSPLVSSLGRQRCTVPPSCGRHCHCHPPLAHAKEAIPSLPEKKHSICKKVDDSPRSWNNPGRALHCRTMRRALLVSSLGRQRHTPTRQSLASLGRPHSTCTLLTAPGPPLIGGLGKQEAQSLPAMVVIAIALSPLNTPKRLSRPDCQSGTLLRGVIHTAAAQLLSSFRRTPLPGGRGGWPPWPMR